MDLREIIEIGTEIFGLEWLIEKAAEKTLRAAQIDDDLVVMTWDTFMRLVYEEGLERQAFNNAWPANGVVPFMIGYGMTMDAAEQISQETAIAAWRNMRRFKAYKSKWTTWLLNIAKNKRIDYLRKLRNRPQTVQINHAITMHADETVEIDERGWSIPVIANEWLYSNIPVRRKLAKHILAAHEGEGFSRTLDKIVSDKSCRYSLQHHFKEFIEEVMRREGYS